jgi:undecaprenyl-diphosphatase
VDELMFISNIIKAIFLGIVQGITEWLPISSTGHLILFDQLLKLNESKEFMDLFDVVIQLGSIIAVVILFFTQINPFSKQKSLVEKRETWLMWLKIIIASLPAAAAGFVFDEVIHQKLYGFLTIALMLIVYGIAFIIVENKHRNYRPKINQLNEITLKVAFIMGMFQMLALIPGTSRSGATILGAIIIGCARPLAAEFAFFMAIPVMFGASGLKILKFILKQGSFTTDQAIILFSGSVVAFLVSLLVIKLFMNYIRSKDFKPFGWYRIILGVVLLMYLFLK